MREKFFIVCGQAPEEVALDDLEKDVKKYAEPALCGCLLMWQVHLRLLSFSPISPAYPRLVVLKANLEENLLDCIEKEFNKSTEPYDFIRLKLICRSLPLTLPISKKKRELWHKIEKRALAWKNEKSSDSKDGSPYISFQKEVYEIFSPLTKFLFQFPT